MSSHSPEPPNLRRPHPLAVRLIEHAGSSRVRVLELGSGSGRNTNALRAAGFHVTAIADDALRVPLRLTETFDAALSTHGLLHGTPHLVRDLVRETAGALRADAAAYFTFASTRDARFGQGRQIDENTFAAADGEEAGVPHVFFGEVPLRRMLEPWFAIDALEEVAADAIVGRWAHARMPSGTVHWFVQLRKRADQ